MEKWDRASRRGDRASWTEEVGGARWRGATSPLHLVTKPYKQKRVQPGESGRWRRRRGRWSQVDRRAEGQSQVEQSHTSDKVIPGSSPPS